MADTFYATIVAAFAADDEVSARLIASTVCENAKADLDADEGDDVWVEGVLNTAPTSSVDTLITRIKVVRNDLIRLKQVEAFDVAKELDKLAFKLGLGTLHDTHVSYDHTAFLELASDLFKGKDRL